MQISLTESFKFGSAIFISSLVFTLVTLFFFKRWKIVDIPNERSSHSSIVPRGGGVAFVITFLGSLIFLLFTHVIDKPFFLSLFISGFILATVGFVDDCIGLKASWRALAQFISAVLALIFLDFFITSDMVNGINLLLFIARFVFIVTGTVWLTNLYNFMDGIDGLAGCQGLFFSIGLILLSKTSECHELFWIGLSLFAPILSFLVFNWSPAKIFMGDVGSSFLGGSFAILIIWAHQSKCISIWPLIILLSIFIVDATITLIIRFFTGQKWLSAHRNHAYQKLSRKFKSHSKVTILFMTINVLWILPLAIFANIWVNLGIIFFIIAILPLIAFVLISKAGLKDA